jgi:hypothetical protein
LIIVIIFHVALQVADTAELKKKGTPCPKDAETDIEISDIVVFHEI